MGKLIIIEGTDGSGKQTQTELIYNKLTLLLGIEKIKKLSFPNYESKSSEPVKMYLSGEFGKNVEDVNAYAASILYSVDRFASFKTEWENFYNGGGVIISDRYTTSNMIHQASKIRDDSEREKYLKWLIDLEWNKIAIPKPDLVLFLDVPFEVSQRLIEERKNKITGDNKKDIHENNKEYLKNSYNSAIKLAKKFGWIIVSCETDGNLKSIEEINQDILNKLSKEGVL